jgi:hypothetical protein
MTKILLYAFLLMAAGCGPEPVRPIQDYYYGVDYNVLKAIQNTAGNWAVLCNLFVRGDGARYSWFFGYDRIYQDSSTCVELGKEFQFKDSASAMKAFYNFKNWRDAHAKQDSIEAAQEKRKKDSAFNNDHTYKQIK